MRLPIVLALVTAAGVLGYVAGRFTLPTVTEHAATELALDGSRHPPGSSGRPHDDDPRRARQRMRDREALDDPRGTEPSLPAVEPRDPRSWATADGAGERDAEATAQARRERDLAVAGETCVELLGTPIPLPDAIAERFSGAAVSHAVREAIGQAGVVGDVESVDCSEFPCIVFGRLAGDEEDIEEIERATALDAYEADVLTLLLWATTVDASARTHPTARETGLFALAYYDADDRDELGAELDRRIRARVLEVWNAERPGPAEG